MTRKADREAIPGYEFSRDFFQRTTGKARLSALESIGAGALAGSATVLLTNPIWVVNTRMTARAKAETEDGLPTSQADISQKKKSLSTVGTFMKIIREEGFMRLFAGVLPALVLVINPILQYTVFEQLKQALEKRRKVTAWDSFLLGALGKLAATSITYPYLTVKSRAHVASAEGSKEGMTATLKRIAREEGIGGLYGGIGPKVTQSVITAAFLFAFKDVLYDLTVKARQTVAKKAASSVLYGGGSEARIAALADRWNTMEDLPDLKIPLGRDEGRGCKPVLVQHIGHNSDLPIFNRKNNRGLQCRSVLVVGQHDQLGRDAQDMWVDAQIIPSGSPKRRLERKVLKTLGTLV
nr:peroxisomal membrane protein pmp47b [Quercus suber]